MEIARITVSEMRLAEIDAKTRAFANMALFEWLGEIHRENSHIDKALIYNHPYDKDEKILEVLHIPKKL